MTGECLKLAVYYLSKQEYVVGFIIEDLDGKRQQVFAAVTVR